MKLYPPFYVGWLKRYLPAEIPSAVEQDSQSPLSARSALTVCFRRDGLAPLIDSAGHQRWVVGDSVAHRDPSTRCEGRHRGYFPELRQYLVRWIGYAPTSDTREPCAALLRDVPNAVTACEAAIASSATKTESLHLVELHEATGIASANLLSIKRDATPSPHAAVTPRDPPSVLGRKHVARIDYAICITAHTVVTSLPHVARHRHRRRGRPVRGAASS